MALPFMILISICVLTGSYMTESQRWRELQNEGGHGLRRGMLSNATETFVETPSDFHFNGTVHGIRARWENQAAHRFYMWGLLALTPVIAAWCIHILVWCVVSGYVTEFISAFLLVLSVKMSVVDSEPGGSVVSVASAGTCFVLIFLMRRNI